MGYFLGPSAEISMGRIHGLPICPVKPQDGAVSLEDDRGMGDIGKHRGFHGTIIEKHVGFDVQRCASPSTIFDDYSEVNFGSEILSW